jgi:hypothetical protein
MSRKIFKRAAVASARAVVPNIDTIISICSLEPFGDWKRWKDPEGNLLRITSKGSVLTFASNNPEHKTKDIFRKSHPSMIAKYSYWTLCIFGSISSLICFMGYDGIFRCSYFEEGKWVENIPPLLCGFHILQIAASGYIDTSVRMIDPPKVQYQKDMLSNSDAWVSGYPIENEELKGKIDWHLMV